jgi:zinc-finger-containing domain
LSKAEAPLCCGQPARLTTGREIYPHNHGLADRHFYKCAACGAYVGCHKGTKRALGIPAGPELRNARQLLHDRRLDPIWKAADQLPDYDFRGDPDAGLARHRVRQTARKRVYAFLADRLEIPREDCHTAAFDLETCRRAWRALAGVTYAEVREWWKAREAAAETPIAAAPEPPSNVVPFPQRITRETLKAATWNVMHADGRRGRKRAYWWIYTCEQFPRIRKIESDEGSAWHVDDWVCDNLDEALELLNKPPEAPPAAPSEDPPAPAQGKLL